jgi:hypothetical protein
MPHCTAQYGQCVDDLVNHAVCAPPSTEHIAAVAVTALRV